METDLWITVKSIKLPWQTQTSTDLLYIFIACVSAAKGIWRVQSPSQTKSDGKTAESHRMWSKMEHKQIPLFLLKDSVSSGANAHGHHAFTASPGLSGPHVEMIYSNCDAATSLLVYLHSFACRGHNTWQIAVPHKLPPFSPYLKVRCHILPM